MTHAGCRHRLQKKKLLRKKLYRHPCKVQSNLSRAEKQKLIAQNCGTNWAQITKARRSPQA